jgi:hypothetical protein
MFVIEEDFHAEWMGRFSSFEEALQELKNYSTIPWNENPNCPPCTGWKTCHRDYPIVEYDISSDPWSEIKKTPIVEISSKGLIWKINP